MDFSSPLDNINDDHDLEEKIQRLSSNLETLSSKLPDKGEKLRSNLRHLNQELHRRRLSRTPRNPTPSSPESPGYISLNITSAGFHPQTSLKFKFCGNSEDKTDSAFGEELRLLNHDKCKGSKGNGLEIQKGRHPIERSSQAAEISCRVTSEEKLVFFHNNGRDTGSSSICTPPSGRSLPRHRSKRRRASAYRDSTNWEFEKVQEVVLLDDEDVQSKPPIKSDGTPAEWKEYKIYYPSRDDIESVELSYSDIKCLDPESYLSSPIMNFYIQYLQRSICGIDRPRTEYCIFNTYFYRKLEEAMSSKGDRTACFLKLRRWWKGENIFEKAYIFLPIHGDQHWSLAVICIPAKEDESGPIILHLDSLGLHNSNQILTIVHGYLKEEWNFINKNAPPSDLPISERIWKHLPRKIEKRKIMVPQQKNDYDCGLFVLYFIERFIREAPERLRKKDLSMFGNKWFKPEEASGLRRRIRELVIKEFEGNRSENEKIGSPMLSV